VVTNLTGANLPTGLAAALAGGRPGAPAVLEVDEAWLGRVAAKVRPAVVVLLNLSRDQLDRNNEVRQVADRWRQACRDLPEGARVVANADDPLVAWAASAARTVTWVGAGLNWKNDATGCPKCAGPVVFEPVGDKWECEACGFARPHPDIWLDPTVPGGRAVFATGDEFDLALQLPGRCNQANAITALAAAGALGHDLGAALVAMAGVTEVAGRYATITMGTTTARLLLAKNPAGWAEVFDMLAPPPGPVVVAINARTADGRDPSWLWDVPFERLAGRRAVVATGERYLDLAVRLQYADIDHSCEADLVAAFRAAGPGNVDVVANYTSFHQLLAKVGSGAKAASGPKAASGAKVASGAIVAGRKVGRGEAGGRRGGR
jgi:UDP-N-acetylmuramyl tripeptide synthase